MSKTESDKTSNQKPTIAEKMEALDQTVEWFYGDDFALDKALDQYQSASKLVAEIAHDLNELKNQVEVLEDFTKD